MGDNASQNVFLCIRPSHTEEAFREFAETAARFKPFGRVMVDVAHLADKTWSDIPEGGSPWHEYTAYKAPLHKFFPPDTLAPHMPADWVQKNRKLLEAKAKVLEELELEGYYKSQDPFFLPDPFFKEYPAVISSEAFRPASASRSSKKCSGLRVESSDSTTALSITFSSSRTFPGQARSSSRDMAAGAMRLTCLPRRTFNLSII